MRKIREKIKYWTQVLLIPVYGLSFLMPRNNKIWLFGSTFGCRFADSPRYFYLYLSQHREEGIRPVWITKKQEIVTLLSKHGYEAYYAHSLKGIWYCLRGKVYLYDNYPKDISHWLSGRAVKINLWHGISLKKIQMDNRFDKIRHPAGLWESWKAFPRRLSDEKPSHYVVSISEFYKPIFSSAFATKRVIVAGSPRTDIFTGNTIKNLYTPVERKCLEQIKRQKKGRKVFFYMPTFRESERKFFQAVDIERLQEFLAAKDYLLCIKLHCKSALRNAFSKLESENIVVIEPDTDPYVFVKMSDVLITDYSSIYLDYFLMGKPVIFFCYDLQDYLSDSREMYFDYDSFTPGIKARSQKELEQAMSETLTKEMGVEECAKREAVLQKAFGEYRKNCCQKLLKALKKIQM